VPFCLEFLPLPPASDAQRMMIGASFAGRGGYGTMILAFGTEEKKGQENGSERLDWGLVSSDENVGGPADLRGGLCASR
jgi:hypothetical protein